MLYIGHHGYLLSFSNFSRHQIRPTDRLCRRTELAAHCPRPGSCCPSSRNRTPEMREEYFIEESLEILKKVVENEDQPQTA